MEKLREVAPRPNRLSTTKMVEVEDEQGNIQLGVVERMTEKGEVVVKVISTGRILTFKPDFPIQG